MSKPRKHHYVPLYILRRFAGEGERLTMLMRTKAPPRLVATHPKNAFCERDLNTRESIDGVKGFDLETGFFSRLDTAGADVTRQCIECIEAGGVPRFDLGGRKALFQLWYNAGRRHPAAFEHLHEQVDYDLIEAKALTAVAKQGGDLAALRERARDPVDMARIRKNADVHARGRQSPMVLDALVSLRIQFAMTGARSSFIVGDCPVSDIGRGGPEFGTPVDGFSMWWPISPRLAVRPGGTGDGVEVATVSRATVRRINERIYRQSSAVAAVSDRILVALARSSGDGEPTVARKRSG